VTLQERLKKGEIIVGWGFDPESGRKVYGLLTKIIKHPNKKEIDLFLIQYWTNDQMIEYFYCFQEGEIFVGRCE